MRKVKASYIFSGIISLKKLMSRSSKFGIDLYWNLFDYSIELYKAHDKIMSMRQEIVKLNEQKAATKKLEELSDKEFNINFDIPVVKRSQIDTKAVTPDDLAILVSNNLIIIEKDEEEIDKLVGREKRVKR